MAASLQPAGGGRPLLSIVVLVYNTAEYLAECFDSLLGQRYEQIEVIAIDDASTDDSLAICRAYESRDPRFRCVARTRNEGGAMVGNQGVAMARGEYVAIVDSDDVVTFEGYSRLMSEAVITSADIVMGRATRLEDGIVSAVSFLYEPFVWTRRRVLASVHDFPDVTHDCFYWNKIFRRDFLLQNRLGMVPGLLYADRPFIHKAYFYSSKTVIVPDLVYLWRIRSVGANVSISQNNANAANYADRIHSMLIEWEDFEEVEGAEEYRRLIALSNMQRALHVIPNIAASPSFRQAFIEGIGKLLACYGDLDFRALGVRRQLYLRLLKLGKIEELCYLLGLPVQGRMVELDGDCYWQQPFLDNIEVPVERALLRLDFPNIGFFQLIELASAEGHLLVDLSLPDAVMRRCELAFEMQPLGGEASVPLVPQGRVAAGIYRFSLPWGAMAKQTEATLLGLVLHYRSGQVRGHYRVGQALLGPAARAALPLMLGEGWQLLFSQEAGGLGMQWLDGGGDGAS